ncbi:MAG TPA: YihY/virulence factor BrkB family protein [Candidatus Baltobacteraceae bacterium]|nr:YihY/virulence factor BrkB family protein [Candidatus Baltobacteraceae bacterium]
MGRVISAFREAGLRFSRDGCAFLAQAVAFNAIFALFPLVVLVLSAASYVYPFAERRLLSFFDNFSPTLHQFVAVNLQSYIFGRGISSAIALVVLIWSGKNLFMGLAYALDRALGVPKGRPLVHNIALSIVMLPAMAVFLTVAMALPVVLSLAMKFANVPDSIHLTHLGAYAISILLVWVATMVLYRFLPNREGMTWAFSLPGATVVALLWPAVQLAFTQYTLHVNFAQIYGALSVPLALLLWFYVVGSTFFYGAEFSAAWHAHTGDAHIPLVVDVIEPSADRTRTTV